MVFNLRCSYCGIIIRNIEDISFCEYCGAKLEIKASLKK